MNLIKTITLTFLITSLPVCAMERDSITDSGSSGHLGLIQLNQKITNVLQQLEFAQTLKKAMQIIVKEYPDYDINKFLDEDAGAYLNILRELASQQEDSRQAKTRVMAILNKNLSPLEVAFGGGGPDEVSLDKKYDKFLNLIFDSDSEEKLDIKKTDNAIDQEYAAFMQELFNLPEHIQVDEIQPNAYLEGKLLNKSKKQIQLLSGKYARPSWISPFWMQHLSPDQDKVNPRGQGWKIHISAMPDSAKKIAELVLSVIQKSFPSQKGKTVSYKIITSIPHMRTLYSLQHVQGAETQPGKFFVIYPENAQHAYELTKALNQTILTAKSQGYLSDNDFLPLVGDAIVGYSNQVYVRYGRHTQGQIKMVDDMNISMFGSGHDLRGHNFVEDNRFTPWPDFMNKGNKIWSSAPNPFNDLPLKWIKDGKTITWDSRPNNWEDLSTNEVEKSRILEDIKQDKDLEKPAEEQLGADFEFAKKLEEQYKQEESDSELAKKLEEQYKQEESDSELAKKLAEQG